MVLTDAFVTKGADENDNEAECYVDDNELPVVPVPKTVIDLPAGMPIPTCAHLGAANIGDGAHNLAK